MFVHKVPCKLVGGLTKLRLSFQSNPQGQGEDDPRQLFAAPVVGLIAKNFSMLYGVEAHDALLHGEASLPGGAVQLRGSHDVKERQEVLVISRLGDSSYKLELSSLVPYSGLLKRGEMKRIRKFYLFMGLQNLISWMTFLLPSSFLGLKTFIIPLVTIGLWDKTPYQQPPMMQLTLTVTIARMMTWRKINLAGRIAG